MKLRKEKCVKQKIKRRKQVKKVKKGVISYGIYINNIWMAK